MRALSAILPALALVFSFAANASAQAGLREGIKVRIHSSGAPETTGVVERVTQDSIVLFTEPAGTRLGLARASIDKLQVSHGKSASQGAKKGALWGLATFGTVGVLIAAASDDNDRAYEDISRAEFAVASVVEGAVIGAIIGALVKAEKWETVPVRPTVAAGAAGLRVGLRFQ